MDSEMLIVDPFYVDCVYPLDWQNVNPAQIDTNVDHWSPLPGLTKWEWINPRLTQMLSIHPGLMLILLDRQNVNPPWIDTNFNCQSPPPGLTQMLICPGSPSQRDFNPPQTQTALAFWSSFRNVKFCISMVSLVVRLGPACSAYVRNLITV